MLEVKITGATSRTLQLFTEHMNELSKFDPNFLWQNNCIVIKVSDKPTFEKLKTFLEKNFNDLSLEPKTYPKKRKVDVIETPDPNQQNKKPKSDLVHDLSKTTLEDYLDDPTRLPQKEFHEHTSNYVVPLLQKILYVLRNAPEIAQHLKQTIPFKSQNIGIEQIIEQQLKSPKTHNENKLRILRVLAEAVTERILEMPKIKDRGITSIDSLSKIVQEIKIHTVQETAFAHLSIDPIDSHKSYHLFTENILKTDHPAEYERRRLLQEDIQMQDEESSDTVSRFEILDALATLLREYRDAIKKLFGEDAQIKFRGSLVRGLKSYGKDGVAPTLDNYDCDAFIEVSDEWWHQLKKLRPGELMQMEEDGPVSTKKLRSYVSLANLTIGEPGKSGPKPTAVAQMADEVEMTQTLQQALFIQKKLQQAIKDSKKLKDYSLKNGIPDFDFYIRPHSSVKHLYEEGNPYHPDMITRRGYPALASESTPKPIMEFRPDAHNLAKHPVLHVAYQPDDFENPMGISLEEYQVVIGKHNWYIEDQHLYTWKQDTLRRKLNGETVDASRQFLPVYSEPLAPIQRPYLKDFDTPTTTKTYADQPKENSLYDYQHSRRSLNWNAKQHWHTTFFSKAPSFHLIQEKIIQLANIDVAHADLKCAIEWSQHIGREMNWRVAAAVSDFSAHKIQHLLEERGILFTSLSDGGRTVFKFYLQDAEQKLDILSPPSSRPTY